MSGFTSEECLTGRQRLRCRSYTSGVAIYFGIVSDIFLEEKEKVYAQGDLQCSPAVACSIAPITTPLPRRSSPQSGRALRFRSIRCCRRNPFRRNKPPTSWKSPSLAPTRKTIRAPTSAKCPGYWTTYPEGSLSLKVFPGHNSIPLRLLGCTERNHRMAFCGQRDPSPRGLWSLRHQWSGLALHWERPRRASLPIKRSPSQARNRA